jgi:HK97 family phage prohead protease
MSTDHERRSAPIELRAKGRRLEGYAATFGTPARIGGFTETILPGAFKNSLKEDVLCLQDHDFSRVLGRTKSGTLRLQEDSRGLFFTLDVPETSVGRDILTLAERGDLGGCSFGFTAKDENWRNKDYRELRSVVLHEISIVSAHPAYPDTEVNARSRMRPVQVVRLTLARRFLSTLENSK